MVKHEKPTEKPTEPQTDPVNDSYTDARGTTRFRPESDLTTEEVIQRRTTTVAGEREYPPDGRYYRVFNVEVPRTSTPGPDPEVDWSDDQHSAMHEANKVAVLQEALNRGLHPQAAARFDGARKVDGGLVYSVEVIPATDDERAAETVTPSKAIADQGGTTLP
jgi:hypothetical protein